MTNKQYLMNNAEHLYVHKLKNVETIADELEVNRKTIMSWKEKHDWDTKRRLYLKSKMTFHEELFEFARKLMREIVEDMDAGLKIDPSRMYAFCRILPNFTKVKDYEDVAADKTKLTPKGLTEDVIAKIEEEVLGIPRQNDNLDDDTTE